MMSVVPFGSVTPYPATGRERSRWVLERRGPRSLLDPLRAYEALVEPECGPDGLPVEVATLFLTNRECPFRCAMCDLWRNTLPESVPPGAIPEQIRSALAVLPPARHLKLYNAGSFFDPKAIPPEDYAEIARQAAGFERVIVECHPAFIGERCVRFRDLLRSSSKDGVVPRLEVAIGLETAHPEVLERLNKRMTLDDFRRAAELLRESEIDLRVFLLVRPPWMTEAEGVEWACRSLELAFDCGATACSLIPTRLGNGALEELARLGEFAEPSLSSLEAALDYGLSLGRGRVFADLWDVRRFAACPHCAEDRICRMERVNLTQWPEPPLSCACLEA